MRAPTRLRIGWQDPQTLKVETDYGMQTRLFVFGPPRPAGQPTWQGSSAAQWEVAGRGRGAPPMFGNLKVVTTNMRPGYLRKNGVPYSADAVLTFRNVHNWMGSGSAQAVFDAAFKALKPGGVLGVEEHRLPASRTQDPKARSGYVQEAAVIKFAEAAGFKLAGRSEINANPKDTADHEGGVWMLPPTNDNKDRAKYLAIGESDRMTLKFVKP